MVIHRILSLATLCAGVSLATGFSAASTPQEDTAAILQRAVTLHQSGKLAEAAVAYEQYLAKAPPHAEIWSNLGAAYAGSGDLGRAIQAYMKALQLDPSSPQIRLNLCLAYFKTADFSESEACLDHLLAAQPSMQAILLLADVRFRRGDYAGVIDLLTPYQDRREDLSVAYLLGTALIRDGQVEAGQRFVDRILGQGNSGAARFMLGTARMQGGDPEGAVDELRAAILLDPTLAGAHSMLGRVLLALNRPGEALAAFRQELALDAHDFDAHFYLGSLLHDQGLDIEALPHLERAVALRPSASETRYQLAVTHLGIGNWDSARLLLEELIRNQPDFIEAHVSLAATYHRLGLVEKAQQVQETIVRLHSEAEAARQGARRSFGGPRP